MADFAVRIFSNKRLVNSGRSKMMNATALNLFSANHGQETNGATRLAPITASFSASMFWKAKISLRDE